MSNYKFKVAIDAEDIYNNLLPEHKELFNTVKITNVELLQDKYVYIECLALEQDIVELPFVQKFTLEQNIRAI